MDYNINLKILCSRDENIDTKSLEADAIKSIMMLKPQTNL